MEGAICTVSTAYLEQLLVENNAVLRDVLLSLQEQNQLLGYLPFILAGLGFVGGLLFSKIFNWWKW